MKNIEDRIKKGISEINVTVETNNIDTREGLMSSGLLDSYGFIELISFIEKEFQISIENEEMTTENFLNIDCAAKFIANKIR